MDGGAVTFTLVFLIVVALLFDLINGMHDAANSIATVVSTRVLKPFYAVFWAAFFNFAAYFLFEAHVANTIGKGLISPELVDNAVIFGALAGAGLAPAQPSGQDRAVVAAATQMEAQARAESAEKDSETTPADATDPEQARSDRSAEPGSRLDLVA